MKVIADFHIHSRFAMACSSAITINGLEQTALDKGINLLSTSDFLHGSWLSELRSNLEEIGRTGLFRIKGSGSGVRFMLGGEVSTVFSAADGSVKKVHHCIALPGFDSVIELRERLSKYGSMDSDGRPQLSLSAEELAETVFSVDRSALLFPAHIWTPFFGVLGANSGFRSIREAYGDQEKNIFAVEKGLSADAEMCRMVSALDRYAILANSDMHSLPNMGREANVFEIADDELSYGAVVGAIREKDPRVFKRTIEFYPQEGKYHFDGHRDCGFFADPKDGASACPYCGKRLVIGVLHRVYDLADRDRGSAPEGAVPFVHAVPLREVISQAERKGEFSVAVEGKYRGLVKEFGSEFNVMFDAGTAEIERNSGGTIAAAIANVRAGRVTVSPGYAGVYGEIDVLNRGKGRASKANQRMLWP